MARKILLFQQSTITSDIKQVVTSITVMTARPVVEENTPELHTEIHNSA
jgi:hypothetical protein